MLQTFDIHPPEIMEITIDRFINPHSRHFGKQTVSFDSKDIADIKLAPKSWWIEGPLLEVTFGNQPSITVSKKEFISKIKEKEAAQ